MIHPFIKFWIEQSSWHNFGCDHNGELNTSEGELAIESFNAGVVTVIKHLEKMGYMVAADKCGSLIYNKD